MERYNAMHFNRHRLVAIDIITSGPDVSRNDLLAISIFPLTSRYEISREINPLDFYVLPQKDPKGEFLNARYCNRVLFDDICNRGHAPSLVAEVFEKWVEKSLKLYNKKLIILSHNWVEKKPFIENWLGRLNYDHYFSKEYRDLMSVALFANDYCDFHIKQVPYPKVKFSYLLSQTKTDSTSDCLARTVAMAECYRKMVGRFISDPY